MHRLTRPSAQTPRGIRRRRPTALIATRPAASIARRMRRSLASASTSRGARTTPARSWRSVRRDLGARRSPRTTHSTFDPVVGHVRSRARTTRRCACTPCLRAGPTSSRRLPCTSVAPVGQRDLGDRAAHDLALQRALRHVASAASRCSARRARTCQAPPPSASALGVRRSSSFGEVSACHSSQRGKRASSRSRQRRRRIGERVEAVPAADLDRAELRVVERLPRDVREAAELVARSSAKSLRSSSGGWSRNQSMYCVVLDAGLAHRRSRSRPPSEHARGARRSSRRCRRSPASGGSGTRGRPRSPDSRSAPCPCRRRGW